MAVVVGHMGKWVDVFRWDRETEGWNKVESLGNWTIFINSSSSCFSTEARRPEMGNKIYFPRFYGGCVVFYSMEKKKWHFDRSEDALSDFHGTKELLNCCWIEPSWLESFFGHVRLIVNVDGVPHTNKKIQGRFYHSFCGC